MRLGGPYCSSSVLSCRFDRIEVPRLRTEVTARTVKLYLDSAGVPGWNEIDAVELVGRDGSHQWARSATASSTYAERGGGRVGPLGGG